MLLPGVRALRAPVQPRPVARLDQAAPADHEAWPRRQWRGRARGRGGRRAHAVLAAAPEEGADTAAAGQQDVLPVGRGG